MGNTPTARRAIRVWLATNEKNQVWLSKKLGITQGALSNILNGHQSFSDELADALLRLTEIDIREFKRVA